MSNGHIVRGATTPGTNDGSFAPHHKAEADPATVTPYDPMTDPAVLEALGAGPELTAGEKEMLGVLLSEQAHSDLQFGGDGPAETLEAFSDFDGFDRDEAKMVANRLHDYYEARDGEGAFEFEEDASGEWYMVSTRVGDSMLWVHHNHDSKYLSGHRYGVTGLRYALHVATTLDGDYRQLQTEMLANGLPGRQLPPEPVEDGEPS